MNKLVTFIRMSSSFTIWDMLVFLFNFGVTYTLMGASLYVSTLLSLSPYQRSLSSRQWAIVLFGSFALVAITYVREIIVTRGKNRQIRESKVIFDCIGGAIEQLAEIRDVPLAEARPFVSTLLRHIEKVVFLVLKQHNLPQGELCANLMVRKTNPDRLELEHFGTFLRGRSRLTLEINSSSLRPGAPEACYYGRVMYIDDTTSPPYKRFFDEKKPYRSIISIPIDDGRGSVFAVLNIDSDVADQFVSSDFISKKILPAISPLVALVRFRKDLVTFGVDGAVNCV